ncbi:OsmC family protein [Salinisphaera sp. P385]|uniref:OsmC family protein n=1 Tax=Spectribacter acetivorans TaxID=3075603 RepID=A0ABU3B3X0_9GAMM|nr:OsmC family protein [Salinisphaera sp. P385]MDT0617156.1 OsmC family protein [Salinisphaera sp. P385]
MKATINWQDNLHFTGSADSGHHIDIDGPPDLGGENVGFRPMELILLGVGSCSAMDVMHILKKARQPVTGCDIEVDGTRADTDPKVFTAIHLRFVVTGDGLSDRQVARAVQLSAEKYCSASIMLQNSVTITHDYEIVSASG